MITERHYIASKIIIEALNKGAYGANLVYTGIAAGCKYRITGCKYTHKLLCSCVCKRNGFRQFSSLASEAHPNLSVRVRGIPS